MKKRSIAYKLIILFTTVTGIVLFIIGIILSIFLNNQYKIENQKILESQLDGLEKSIIQYLEDNENVTYEDILKNMEILDQVLKVDTFIFDNKGYIYIASNEEYKRYYYTKFNIKEENISKLKNNESVLDNFTDANQIEKQMFVQPISLGEHYLGGIALSWHDQYVDPTRKVYLSIWLSITGSLILSSIVLSFFLKRVLLKPLDKINTAARKLSTGNVEERILVASNDEIGELSDSFNIMADSLDKVDKKRKEFISNVSHELRSPLTSIKGLIAGITDGVIPKDKEDYYLDIVQQEVDRLSRLVNDLLDISSMESGKFKLKISQFDINELISSCVLNAENKIRERGLEVEIVYYDKYEYVLGDRDRLIQVVTNILENAFKYGELNGKIKIKTYEKSDKVHVSIFNSGPNIAKEDINYIWDRFYKNDKSRTNKISTGLGLPIVRLIVSQHDGEIWVNNIDGKGVEFVFTLNRPQ